MRYLIDTSVLVDHLRGKPQARELLLTMLARGDELWSVTVVRPEILAGAKQKELVHTAQFLNQFRWIDVNSEIADVAGTLAAKYLRSHRHIDTIDYLIAAATQVLGASLKTMNVKHFPMFPNLRPAY